MVFKLCTKNQKLAKFFVEKNMYPGKIEHSKLQIHVQARKAIG